MLAFISEHTTLCILIALFVLNGLIGYRSQIDSWCEAHPLLAAPLKALRTVADPWMLVQATTLALKKELPKALKKDFEKLRMPDGRTVAEAIAGGKTVPPKPREVFDVALDEGVVSAQTPLPPPPPERRP